MKIQKAYKNLVVEKEYIIFFTFNMTELNKYSKTITQDPTQPAAQAMFYGIGLTDDDLKKAQVGIVSMGYDGNTCNMHLNELAKIVKRVCGIMIWWALFLIPLA